MLHKKLHVLNEITLQMLFDGVWHSVIKQPLLGWLDTQSNAGLRIIWSRGQSRDSDQ